MKKEELIVQANSLRDQNSRKIKKKENNVNKRREVKVEVDKDVNKENILLVTIRGNQREIINLSTKVIKTIQKNLKSIKKEENQGKENKSQASIIEIDSFL